MPTTLNAFTGFSRGKPNASTTGPPSKPDDDHRVNTLFTSLAKVLAEIEDRFSGNYQVVFCALGDVTLSNSPASDSFDLVAGYYNFEKELLRTDQRLFNRLKKAHIEILIKTATEVINVLRENSLYEIKPEFSKVAHFGRHSPNIMLSGTSVQRNPAKT